MSGRLHSNFVYLTPSTGIASSGPATDSDGPVVVDVRGYSVLGIQIDSGNDGAIQIEGVIEQQADDSAGWRILTGARSSDQARMTSYTPDVDWDSDGALIFYNVAGLSGVRLHQTGTPGGGAVIVWGRLSVGSGQHNFIDIDISSGLVSSDLADSDVLTYGADDSSAVAVFRTERYDTDGIAAPSSDLAETLAAVALAYGYEATGAVWNRMTMDTDARLRVSETWNSTLQIGESTAVQDRVFTVPANEDWHIMWIWVEYTSGSAETGNRQLVIQVRDSADDVIQEIIPGVTQSSGLTYFYNFAPGNADLTAIRSTDNLVTTPLPATLILPELFDIRVFDGAVITGGDTAAEDMIVQMMVMNRQRVSA